MNRSLASSADRDRDRERVRRSDSLRSVSDGSVQSEDSRGSNGATNQQKGKSVSFNNNVRVQYPRRTSQSFSKFDSLNSLNGRISPVTNGNEIDYSNTNLNGNIPYASSPHHQNNKNIAPSPLKASNGTGRKFWSNVWRSNSTRRAEDSPSPAGHSNIIKYKVKHNSPLVSRKLATSKRAAAGSESPQVRRNHVRKIVSLFNKQAAVAKAKLKEQQDSSGPKKGLHDLLPPPTMPVPTPSSTLPRTTRSSSPNVLRPTTSPPAPPPSGTPFISSPQPINPLPPPTYHPMERPTTVHPMGGQTTVHPMGGQTTVHPMGGQTTVKRTVSSTPFVPKSYEHVSFNPIVSDSSVNTSDKENSYHSNSSFLNRDSGISMPSMSPIRSASPGPFISTVTLNHSEGPSREYRHEFRRDSPYTEPRVNELRRDTMYSDPKMSTIRRETLYTEPMTHTLRRDTPYKESRTTQLQRETLYNEPATNGHQSSDESLYSDNLPPQRPLRSKPSLNIPPPPMKDVAIQTPTQLKPGNLTPVEEFPSRSPPLMRVHAPLYSQVNKALKKPQGVPPPPPPLNANWTASHTLPAPPPPARWGSSNEINHSTSKWKNGHRPGSPVRFGESYADQRATSPRHYSDMDQQNQSDFFSDAESAASRSRTPVVSVKSSSRSFGFNLGTKKKTKSKKSKPSMARNESDSSSTSSTQAGPERKSTLLRTPSRTPSKSQKYNSMLDIPQSYNRSAYPSYEDEYGPPPKPPNNYSWSLSLGRAPKSKRSVDGGSTTGPITQVPRRAYSDVPSSIDEEPFRQQPSRGGLAAAFHHRNARNTPLGHGDPFNSGASSCGSLTASEAAGVREPIVMYIPGVQRTGKGGESSVNRSNSFLHQSSTLNRDQHKSRFAKQEGVKGGKNERYKPKDSSKHTQVQRSKSIPRNAKFL